MITICLHKKLISFKLIVFISILKAIAFYFITIIVSILIANSDRMGLRFIYVVTIGCLRSTFYLLY